MRYNATNSIRTGLVSILALPFFSACAPFSSDGKADRDGTLNSAEVAVWVQSTTDESGKYRVLFGVPNRADSVEICKIPAAGMPAGFVCDQSKEGYLKLAQLTDKGDRKIFIADKLAIENKSGYAAFGRQAGQILWNGPRLAYFGKKDPSPGAGAGSTIQFTQIQTIMNTSCSGGNCHSTGQPRDLFFTNERAFTDAKAKLNTRLNSADPQVAMPRGKSFQGNDKQIMLNYLNQIR